MYNLDYYIDEKGNCLFDDYLKQLKKNGCIAEIEKIEHYISLLKDKGERIFFFKDHAKRLVYDLCELRPYPNRVFYYFCRFNNKYVILHIFKKKTNKTPDEEIEKAINEINNYERMIKNGK